MPEITRATALFLIAGTETTTSAMSATLYFLLTHPDKLNSVYDETRNCFTRLEEATIESTENQIYMKACILEAMRLYPPLPGPFPRLVPAGGAMICGNYVPENTVVSILQWAMHHSSQNFGSAESFKPERWLAAQEEGEEKAFHPFNIGPRACIAQE